jgi:formylglycine-generating enzyme required for sulfatase activity
MADNMDSRSDMPSRSRGDAFVILSPGRQVGRFTLLEFLGEGGMGSVWSAEDPTRKDDRHDGRVVLKFLRDDIRRCPEAVEQFKAAYRKVQRLIHEHICPLLDLGEDPAFGAFQVMPYVRGTTLLELLKKADPNCTGLSAERVHSILRPVAKALDYAHREGLVHRDIKPGNIMVDVKSGKVFVVDFGLAAEVRTSMSMHSRSVMGISGTEPYMAPEQWLGQAQDGRSDQYSLAVVAWHMLTGSLPYQGSGHVLGFAVTQGPIPELPESLQHLQSVMAQALAKDRRQRYPGTAAFVDALRNATNGEGSSTRAVVEAQSSKVVSNGVVPSTNDLASILQKTQESLSRKQSQARQSMEHHRYCEVAEILAGIPEHLRDEALYTQAIAKRDRVTELEVQIRQAVTEVRLKGLRPLVQELLALQPSREDMQRLLTQLPAAVRPPLLVAPFNTEQAKVGQKSWAEYLGIDVEVMNSIGMKFRIIPPGIFDMGSPTSEPERSDDETLHRVTISQPKLVGVYPVTQAEWTTVMGSNPSHFSSMSDQDTNCFPVECVSWDDTQEFLERLNASHALEGWSYRLLSEAEWEYTCRGGTVAPYWFGGKLNGKEANCDGNYPYQTSKGPYLKRPSAVGSYGANPFGLHDQHGNIQEWCQDWFGSTYDHSVTQDPAGPTTGSSRLLRGGSWYNVASGCRSAYRYENGPSYRLYYVGFRVLCELS